MAITILDLRTALVLIDLQKGIVGQTMAHPTGDVVARAARLAGAFRTYALPVVLVTVHGGAPGRVELRRHTGDRPPDWDTLVPELPVHAGDYRIGKRTWGAFTGTGLEGLLRACGVTGIAIAGIATSIGVESTARQAYELGFNVALAHDAMTDFSREAHDNSVQRIFPRLGETGTADEIGALLARRAS
ncbi:isochorismatase family protein [Acidiferrobacter sp.]|uniref:isochorismatase family protein n=1 Tax=Acidiferrobacter sp. TaxID=1872107 RepID=UPI00262BC9BB|nr:isochorismatase family protein [Acidiferrobacter sp.]